MFRNETGRRLYVNADRTKVVEAGDPEAASLLVGVGGEIELAEAERLGLTGKKAKETPPETKHVETPPATKAQEPPPRRGPPPRSR